MKLWLSCFLLFATALLGSSAPMPEECQALVTPLSLADPVYGRLNLLAGYTNYAIFKFFLKMTDSCWGEISASPTSTTEVLLFQVHKINGTCIESTTKMTLDGDTGTTLVANMTSVFHVLPSCEGCLVFSANYTDKNFKNLLKLMKIGHASATDEPFRGLYLLGPKSTLKDSDLEHFKKQASCLGFSGEPDFRYNPEKGFCQKGEGIKWPALTKP